MTNEIVDFNLIFGIKSQEKVGKNYSELFRIIDSQPVE